MNASFPRALKVFMLLAAGALAISTVRPVFAALAAPGVPAMWWSARVLGLLALVALCLSVAFGVFMAGKGAGGLMDKPAVAQLHGRWSLVTQLATALHVLFVVADPDAGVTPLATFLPLTSSTLTGPVALGTFALWGLALLIASSALSKRLSKGAWRAIHASAFGTFLLATVHGATTGTDTHAWPVRILYLVASGLVLAAIVQRLLLARHARQRAEQSKSVAPSPEPAWKTMP